MSPARGAPVPSGPHSLGGGGRSRSFRVPASIAVTRPDVRVAAVTVRWSDGTVLAGRTIREVERRVDVTQELVFLGWASTLVALAVACIVAVRLLPAPRNRS